MTDHATSGFLVCYIIQIKQKYLLRPYCVSATETELVINELTVV